MGENQRITAARERRAYLGHVSLNVRIWSEMRYNGVYFALGMSSNGHDLTSGGRIIVIFSHFSAKKRGEGGGACVNGSGRSIGRT